MFRERSSKKWQKHNFTTCLDNLSPSTSEERPSTQRVRSRQSGVVWHRSTARVQGSPHNHLRRVSVVVSRVHLQAFTELCSAGLNSVSRRQQGAEGAGLFVHNEELCTRVAGGCAHCRPKTMSHVLLWSTSCIVPRASQYLCGVCELSKGPRTKLVANVRKALIDVLETRKFVSFWAHGADFVDSERAAVMRCTVHSGKCKSEKEGTHCCGLCALICRVGEGCVCGGGACVQDTK